ncbi:hypothetical protein PYCC9005_003288 [Savitreella phatthalungensis]
MSSRATDQSDVGRATYVGIERWMKRMVFVMLSIAMLTAGLQAEILGDAAPTIAVVFSAQTMISWLGAAGFLIQAATELFFGRIFDLIEPRIIMLFLASSFILGTVLSATATSFEVIVLGQAICGLARSGIVIGSVMILAVLESDRHKRAMLVAIVSGMYGIMLKLAPVVAGAILTRHSDDQWRWVFWVALPLQIMIFIGAFAMPTLRRRRNAFLHGLCQIDIIGGVLSASWIICFVLPFVLMQKFSGEQHWGNMKLIVLYILTPLLALFSTWWEWRKPESKRYIPLRIITADRSVICYAITSAVSSFIIAASTFYMPVYLQIVRKSSPLLAALQQLPCILLGSLASVIVGRFILTWGPTTPRAWCVVGNLVAAVAGLSFWATDYDMSLTSWFATTIVLGIGSGITFAIGVTLIIEKVPSSRFGAASAFMSTATALGGVLGITLHGIMVSNSHSLFYERARNAAERYVDSSDPRIALQASQVLNDLENTTAMAVAVGTHAGPLASLDSIDISSVFPGQTADNIYRQMHHDSMKQALVMYAVAAVLGLIASLFVRPHVTLDDQIAVTSVSEARHNTPSSRQISTTTSEDPEKIVYKVQQISHASQRFRHTLHDSFDAKDSATFHMKGKDDMAVAVGPAPGVLETDELDNQNGPMRQRRDSFGSINCANQSELVLYRARDCCAVDDASAATSPHSQLSIPQPVCHRSMHAHPRPWSSDTLNPSSKHHGSDSLTESFPQQRQTVDQRNCFDLFTPEHETSTTPCGAPQDSAFLPAPSIAIARL